MTVQCHIFAEEHVLLTQDPTVQMMSHDLERQEVNIVVHRRQVPCTLAVLWDDGKVEGSSAQRPPVE